MRIKPILLPLLALLLLLLPACGTQSESEPVPEQALPAADIARALSASAPDEPEGELEVPEEQLADYARAAYGLEGGTWEDCAVFRGAGVRAYEIAVLRFAGEEGARQGEDALGEYLASREGDFYGYAPEQAALVSGGAVCRQGRYIGAFICEDPESIKELFLDILESGTIPEPPPEPSQKPTQEPSQEPSQEPTPEPLQKPEAVTDMESLKDAVLYSCRDELTALDDYTVSMYASDEGFSQMVEETYGIPAGAIADGFTVRAGGSPFEIVVLGMTDKDAAEQYYSTLNTYWTDVMAYYWKRDEEGMIYITEDVQEDYDLVTGGHLNMCMQYVALFLCEDAGGVSDVFSKGVLAMTRAERPQTQPPAVPTIPPVEIADGVYFAPVPWPEAEGEPDPDHPGRLLYVQPNEVDMSVYDTSAIAAAWASGDPSGLSDYDRAIYDAAKEVLGEILQEGMSDFAKEAAIYEWVLENVEYDWSATDVLAEFNRDGYGPYGGLVDRSAVCLGYATTFELLMDLSGLECRTVVGAGAGGDHAWNVVRLNGEWYCADLTWDVSFYSAGMTSGRVWRFFNTTSDYMAKTGHMWDYDSVPEATAEDHGASAA